MEAAGDVVSRAAPLPARRVLSAEDVALFHERGWLVVPNILSGEELEELRAHSRRLARQEVDLGGLGAHHRAATLKDPEADLLPSSAPESELDPAASTSEDMHFRYFQFHRHMPLHEKYLLHPRILDCLEALIGADILALQSQLFLKPPGQPGQTYHQDAAYIRTQPDTLLGSWLAIDDSSESNGGLRFVQPEAPAIMDEPLREFDAAGISERANKDAAEPGRELVPHVPAGSVMFFHGHLLHSSRRNESETSARRSFVCHYCSANSDGRATGARPILARGSSSRRGEQAEMLRLPLFQGLAPPDPAADAASAAGADARL